MTICQKALLFYLSYIPTLYHEILMLFEQWLLYIPISTKPVWESQAKRQTLERGRKFLPDPCSDVRYRSREKERDKGLRKCRVFSGEPDRWGWELLTCCPGAKATQETGCEHWDHVSTCRMIDASRVWLSGSSKDPLNQMLTAFLTAPKCLLLVRRKGSWWKRFSHQPLTVRTVPKLNLRHVDISYVFYVAGIA